MIELYTAATPNGRKISIALEEMAIPYTAHNIDIHAGDQNTQTFRAINPLGKIPVIVDHEGPNGKPFTLIESGAILLYLAEKSGKFLPVDPARRMQTIAWLIHQVASQGPMFGQASHFLFFAPQAGNDIPYGKQRYAEMAQGICAALDQRLQAHPYIAGDDYSIADMAAYPWIGRGLQDPSRMGINPQNYPTLQAWSDRVGARPAVQRGMDVPKV